MTDSTTTASSLVLYRRLLAYIGPLRVLLLLSVLGFSLFGAANIWFADLVGTMIDSIGAGASVAGEQRLLIPLTLISIVAMRGLGGFLGSYCMASMAFKIIHQLRCEILGRLLRLPVPYYDRNSSGHLISTVTFNVSQISAAVSDALAVLIREGLTIFILVAYLLYLNWKLTLVFVAIAPLISLVVVFASGKFRKHSKRIQASMGDVTQILNETLKGLKVIRIFGAEKQIGDKFTTSSALNTRQNMKLSITAAISAPIIQTLVGSALALLLWMAMSPEALGSITPGEFVSYITAAGMLMKPVRQTSKVNADIQKGLAAAASIFAMLDTPGETDHGTHTVERVQGKVEFRDVTFAYADDAEPVLKQVSLTCPPGKTVAIVGHSGSGKSTLVNLLPRFYELGLGQILIDDVPHKEYTLQSLRHQIALVSQQVVLFNGSIRDNIAYGELAGVSDAAIEAALTNANAHEFVNELPLGLDTMVGDDGLLLSGGQRQRLAIARALLKNAPILILDEATSALDSASERYIQSALERLMQGRTTLVIAHRLSTIENADLIVVLDKGRVVESGTHQELLAREGAYQRLHRMQFTDVTEA
jgi:subfamily B ATP-binding cassette protein MsbA